MNNGWLTCTKYWMSWTRNRVFMLWIFQHTHTYKARLTMVQCLSLHESWLTDMNQVLDELDRE